MKNKIKVFIYNFLTSTVGNALLVLRPKKAKLLSENRIILVFKHKSRMTIEERLMRGAILRKMDDLQDHASVAEMNRKFWMDTKATELFTETEDTFQTDFMPHCTFIFDLLSEEMSREHEQFDTLVEIGTGNGDVLNYLSSRFPDIERFIGIDLSTDQIGINKKKFLGNGKLEFVAADAIHWIQEKGHGNTIFVSSRGVLEYFLEPDLQAMLKTIHSLGKIMFVAIEPNGADHNFKTQPSSQLYGDEPSFSHNYPLLFKNAGFSIWHFSQKPWFQASNLQTFIGAKN